MRNLELQSMVKNAVVCLEDVTHAVVHNKIIYLLKNEQLFCVENGEFRLLSPEIYKCVTSLEYIEFENKVWFGTGNEFVYYTADVDVVSTIPMEDFTCAVWNSTQEALAVIFENTEVATYAIDFENGFASCTKKAHINDAVPQTVYVGWGSENTQFRGSEGKLKAGIKKEEIIEVIEDKTPRITWRGNGEMFAINYWKNGVRSFKVFEYPCSPAYECESTLGLQSCIAWRPVGNMIACSVCVNNNNSIVIFEKNGFKRFSIPLVQAENEIKALKWSPNGEILAVQQENGMESFISLYVSSNYKWYLKQHMCYAKKSMLINFEWVSSSLSLRTYTTSNVLTYTFRSVVDRHVSTVAVIDGPKLLVTPFSETSTPPPMSFTELTVGNPINFVIFHNVKMIIAVVDSRTNVTVFGYENFNFEKLREFAIDHIMDEGIPLSKFCFHWIDDEIYYMGLNLQIDHLCGLRPVGLDPNIKRKILVRFPMKIPPDRQVTHLENDAGIYGIEILRPIVMVIDVSEYTFLRNQFGSFSINEKCVCNGVTSFIIHDNKYLIFTSTQNRLYCVRLVESEINKLLKSQNVAEDFFSRPIEQGATLICAVPNTSTVILQIPRGNLEIISCRLIAIDILEDLLNRNMWKDAIKFIRTDRLNPNLLIDLNPDRFLGNIGNFVDACETASVLNNICLELDDGNILLEAYSKSLIRETKRIDDKRKTVCKAILDHLKKVDYTNYVSSIVVINVHHFGIEDALICIQNLLHEKDLSKIAMEAVKILYIYAKYEDLYKKSLLLYDLSLAKYIAGFSQMDPKTYEPFLEELSALSESERRFRINVYLNKPNVAVKYLIRTANVYASTVIDFVKKHDVSDVVYPKLKVDSELFKEISRLYGMKLVSKKLHEEAAVVFLRSNHFENAFEEFKSCLNWQMAIVCLKKFVTDELQQDRMISQVADDLILAKRSVEASRIYLEYLDNFEMGLKVLTDAGHFQEAMALIGRCNRYDVIVTDIIPSINNHCFILSAKILNAQKEFVSHKDRLETVRIVRIASYKNESLDDGDSVKGYEDGNIQKDIDLYSDAGSQATTRSIRSRSSRMSTQSSRNRKKEERKKQDLRVGGVYEDIALIRALYNIISEVAQVGLDIREVCLVLLELGHQEKAKYLQKLLKSTQNLMKDNIKKIWPDCFNVNCKNEAVDECAINENLLALDEKYRMPPPEIKSDWEITILNV